MTNKKQVDSLLVYTFTVITYKGVTYKQKKTV